MYRKEHAGPGPSIYYLLMSRRSFSSTPWLTPQPHHRAGVLFLVLLAGLLLSGYTNIAKAQFPGSSGIEQRYNESKFYFNQLLTNHSISSERDSWQRGAQNFRQLYLSDPQSDYAPACLFMLGQMHFHMFERFKQPADLDYAISYYTDVTRLFPKHRLADDSYYAIGLILLKAKRDPDGAAEMFARIIQEYPAGDMHPQAGEMLKQLSKDHNVALPDVMLENTTISKLNYILPVKYWSSDEYTRIVIMASGPVSYREELLEPSSNKPRRLYIDFRDSYIEPKYREPLQVDDGLLKQVRTAQFSKDTVRVVLDIESIDSYKIYSLPEPFRVVVDVRGKPSESDRKSLARLNPANTTEESTVAQEYPAGVKQEQSVILLSDQKKFFPGTLTSGIVHLAPKRSVNLPAEEQVEARKLLTNEQRKIRVGRSHPRENPLPAPGTPELTTLSLAQQLGLRIKRIVLDPGHGGKDPGAQANGLQEKTLVLEFARQLKPILEQEIGCEVLLTRDTDTFISLEERTAIANTEKADLFLSIHLNAHPSPDVRGLETYYLNLSTNAEAMRVAAMENATSTNQMSDLQDILQDILQNSKITESSRLADQVHGALVAGLSSNDRFGKLHNLGIKQAPFYVLIGAQMPAILLELAFITNNEDVANIQTADYMQVMAKEIASGVQGYVNATTAKL